MGSPSELSSLDDNGLMMIGDGDPLRRKVGRVGSPSEISSVGGRGLVALLRGAGCVRPLCERSSRRNRGLLILGCW